MREKLKLIDVFIAVSCMTPVVKSNIAFALIRLVDPNRIGIHFLVSSTRTEMV